MEHKFEKLSYLKIFLKRGDNKRGNTWWERLFEKPLSNHLVNSALQSGIIHASVQLGQTGYIKGATRVSIENAEIPSATLPACVELVASREVLESFIEKEKQNLKSAVLILFEGSSISLGASENSQK